MTPESVTPGSGKSAESPVNPDEAVSTEFDRGLEPIVEPCNVVSHPALDTPFCSDPCSDPDAPFLLFADAPNPWFASFGGDAASDVDTFLFTDPDAADPDGFGNLGVWTGDAITDWKPVAGIMYPLQGVLLTGGPKKFAAETTIQVEANAAAATGGTGTMTVVVYYFVDPNFSV